MELTTKPFFANNYDFLLENIDVGGVSENQDQYTRLIKSVKNFQPVSVEIKIPLPKDKSKTNKFRIIFGPSKIKAQSLYSIFTFDKIVEVDEGILNQNQGNYESKSNALHNLERSLRNERLLRKVSDLIVSDIPLNEIANNIAQFENTYTPTYVIIKKT